MKEKNSLKFRAWDKKNQRWMTKEIENEEESEIRLDLWGHIYFRKPWFEQESGTITIVSGESMFDLSQSTGIKDMDGIEIFEGDIVKLNVPTYKTTTKVIETLYDAFVLENNVESSDYIEVIGNIWENPELLEVTE